MLKRRVEGGKLPIWVFLNQSLKQNCQKTCGCLDTSLHCTANNYNSVIETHSYWLTLSVTGRHGVQ